MSRTSSGIIAFCLSLIVGQAAFADPATSVCGGIVIGPMVGAGGDVTICAASCTGSTGTATGGSTNSDTTTSYPGSRLVFSVVANSDGTYGFTFSNPGSLDLSYINSVTITDLDGDGFPDLILGVNNTATGGAGVQVLLNDGTGSGIVVYQTTLATGASSGAGPVSVATDDVDGDGWDDIITANGSDDSVSVLINNGDGTFAAPTVYPIGVSAGTLSTQDLNQDGADDLLLNTGGTLTVLLNNGDGSYAPAVNYVTGGNFTTVYVEDLVGDGSSDLVLFGGSSGVGTLMVKADGSYGTTAWTAVHADGIGVDDFNNDGVPDLAAVDTAGGQVAVLTGNGDGSFAAPAVYATGSQPYDVWSFDQNGDGWEDIVTDNGDGTQSLLLNNGDGTFAAAQTYTAPPINVCFFAMGGVAPGAGAQIKFKDGVLSIKGLKRVHTLGTLSSGTASASSGGAGVFDIFGLLFLAGLTFLRRRSV